MLSENNFKELAKELRSVRMRLSRIVAFWLIVAAPHVVKAQIVFENDAWKTTFDCGEWSQATDWGNLDCDGLVPASAGKCDGSGGLITLDANNPEGGGGKGLRHWVGDGSNMHSGGIGFMLQPQKELWIRWYMKYEEGFKWEALVYDKWVYMWTVDNAAYNILGLYDNNRHILFRLVVCIIRIAEVGRIYMEQGLEERARGHRVVLGSR
jgi:hypothetical protein